MIKLLQKPIRSLLIVVAIILVFFYWLQRSEQFPVSRSDTDMTRNETVAIFGATGTAGDGLLAAAMADPGVKKIHVITRRLSPRIEAGVASDEIEVTMHFNYVDYSALSDLLKEVDSVFWALGTSALSVTKEEYGVIHVDFPLSLLKEWLLNAHGGDLSLHYISGAGANTDGRQHWQREKARAENALFEMAEGTSMRVISYRPAYIVPAKERANFGHNLAHFLFAPIKLAVRSEVIGRAMLEVGARGRQIGNRTIIKNTDIIMFANGYRERLGLIDDQ